MFKQFRSEIEKQAEGIITDFWKPNSEKTLTLASDLRQHIERLREKIDADEVELKIAQVSDEIGQLESDLIIAEADDSAADAKAINKMIDERTAELAKLRDDLRRKKSDVLNSRTLAFKANPFLESLRDDIEHYELTLSNHEIMRTEITDLIDYLKDIKKNLHEAIIPTVNATGFSGTTHPTNIATDIAEYILPDEIKRESDRTRGIELYEYARRFEAPKQVEKYAFFKKK